MTDPVRVYLDAMKKFKALDSQVDSIAEDISFVADNLSQERRRLFSFTDAQTNQVRKGGGANGKNFIDITARKWRSAAEINGILEKWDEIRDECMSTYRLIPEYDRNNIEKPPQLDK